jgi:AraC-like DNA-binding protein
MDPLSDVLSLVKITNHWSERFQWGSEWCLQFGPYRGIRTYAVINGSCWLAVDGISAPVKGKAGDCLLLPSGRAFRVGSDLKLAAISAEKLTSGDTGGALARRYAGDAFIGLGSHFTLNNEHDAMLLTALPPILHINDDKNKAALQWTLDRLADELCESRPGGALVVQQLSTLLLVQALRAHLSEGSSSSVGWLSAMRDRRIHKALSAMHAEPGHRWTVQALGERAGMSRTSFATRFKETVGKGPLEYLTEWRMMLASDRLTKSSDSISMIAGSLGYESDGAFSTAFKRVMHCSPRDYVRSVRR